ncbi:GMC oxidoreductase [Aureimonas populi]|uniref:GMC oxidoreductase n=1 Tax=Aureimonas populi TaxID=1701758 RepID=A0ABW5CMS8_9HYPH|nr:GMC oxidoreductase [Aureimonas populi]
MPIFTLDKAEGGADSASAAFCIIGGGVAGLLVANRLAQAGQRVIVIESGLEVFDTQADGLNEIESSGRSYVGALTGRSRILGGSSSRWGGCMVPLTAHDLGPRPYISLPAWPLAPGELERHQPELDRLFHLDHSPYDSLDEPDLPPPYEDLVRRWPKWIAPKHRNVAVVLRETIRKNKNLTVWLGATAQDFVTNTESGRLESIVARGFNGRAITVRADRFVFAAGSLETTRLLLLMDRYSNGRIFEGCDALGHYFQDHLSRQLGEVEPMDRDATSRLFGRRYSAHVRRSLHLELSAEAQRKYAVSSAYARIEADVAAQRSIRWIKSNLKTGGNSFTIRQLINVVEDAGDISRLVFDRFAKKQLFMPKDVPITLSFVVEQVPQWENRLYLSQERDALGMPKAHLSWRTGEVEERTFRTCMEVTRAYWRACGLDKICSIRWDADLSDPVSLVAERAGDWAHPSGTTRMGTDPRTSVVRPDLECHHIPNVSVVSASTFPTAGASNPTLTLMRLALRCADTLLAESRKIAMPLAGGVLSTAATAGRPSGGQLAASSR